MRINKAREYFCSYYEGTLEEGLRSQLEKSLAEDAELALEYQTYRKAIKAVEAMRETPIAIPFDLNERIARRVDRAAYEQKEATRKPALLTWWRSLALGAVATVALIGALFTLQNRSNSQAFQASMLPGSDTGIKLEFTDGKWVAVTRGETSEHMIVRDLETGDIVQESKLEPVGVVFPIENRGLRARVLELEVRGSKIHLAIPGTQRSTEREGQGSLLDLVKAAAEFYGKAVRLQSDTKIMNVQWMFANDEATLAEIKTTDREFRFEVREGGLFLVGN